MYQLMFDAAGEYAWRDASDPEITAPEQAIVRPVAVACCDLDVAVAEGRLPMPPGPAVGPEGGGGGMAGGGAPRGGKGGGRGGVSFPINRGEWGALPAGRAGGGALFPLFGL